MLLDRATKALAWQSQLGRHRNWSAPLLHARPRVVGVSPTFAARRLVEVVRAQTIGSFTAKGGVTPLSGPRHDRQGGIAEAPSPNSRQQVRLGRTEPIARKQAWRE